MPAYCVEVTFTPLCGSCGKELQCLLTQSDNTRVHGPFERDNPTERKDRRVFIEACTDCYTFSRGKS